MEKNYWIIEYLNDQSNKLNVQTPEFDSNFANCQSFRITTHKLITWRTEETWLLETSYMRKYTKGNVWNIILYLFHYYYLLVENDNNLEFKSKVSRADTIDGRHSKYSRYLIIFICFGIWVSYMWSNTIDKLK